jgi:hypothetical protein
MSSSFPFPVFPILPFSLFLFFAFAPLVRRRRLQYQLVGFQPG